MNSDYFTNVKMEGNIPENHNDSIIIEELDSSNLQQYDLNEFQDAVAIKFASTGAANTFEDNDVIEPNDEIEKELREKFLRGEMTFGEYSARTDGGSDIEDIEGDYITSLASDSNICNESKPSTSKDIKDVSTVLKTVRPKKKRRKMLPAALKGLMGEANLRYALGETAAAEKICYEIIRQVPTAPEPFITLSQIYETENPKASLQFSLIAAHVSPQDAQQWIRLAIQSEEFSDIKQAIVCYSRAIKANPPDIAVHERRIQLVESLGHRKIALKYYMKMLTAFTEKQSADILKTAKMLASNYHSDNDIQKAHDAMEIAYKKCPQLFTIEEVNLFLELLIALQKYETCLKLLVEHGDITVEAELYTPGEGEEERMCVIDCLIPNTLLIDLRIKLTVCLIHLRAFHLLDKLINHLLLHEDVEECGDLYLDVAEALMKEKKYSYALKLLVPLIDSEKYSLAAVWLRHAECLHESGMINESITSYQTVIHMAPQHLEPRLVLANLLKSHGRNEEALAALEQDEDLDTLDAGLLYERCKLLKDIGDLEQYLHVGQLLLSRHCVRIRNREEIGALTRLQKIGRKGDALKEVRRVKGEEEEDVDAPTFSNTNEPPLQTEWLFFKDLINVSHKLRKYALCQRLAFSALGSKKFKDYATELEFTCMLSCLYTDDGFFGYNLIRDIVQKHPDKPRAWNLYNLIIQRADDGRHNRFLMRLLNRKTFHVDPVVHVLNGNNCLVAGTYKYALSEYVTRYKGDPKPMYAFFVAVTMFQMCCQKYSAKRPSLMTQGIAFFKLYRDARGEEVQHEVHYNFGRAFHQIGLLPSAIHHYNKVLELTNAFIESKPNVLDLRREAAYNAHLIFKKSGSFALARMYLQKYIVV